MYLCLVFFRVIYSPPNIRGVIVLQVDFRTCHLIAARQFDTSTTSSAAGDLASYLGSVANGTVLVGVTAFDPMTRLSIAQNSLSALGVSVNDVQTMGSFAFVAQKGWSSKTLVKKSINVNQPAAGLTACLSGKKSRLVPCRW